METGVNGLATVAVVRTVVVEFNIDQEHVIIQPLHMEVPLVLVVVDK